LVDFDGDRRLGLISGSNCCDSSGFHVFHRKENGSWTPRRRLEITIPGKRIPKMLFQRSFVTAADWNGDGVPDLLCVAPGGEGILVAFGPFKENEPIAFTHLIDFTPQTEVYDFAIADWDRDGKPDLLVHFYHTTGGGEIYWYKNRGGAGRPKLAERKLLISEKSSDAVVQGFCVCDWNGDGWPDLIVTRDEWVGGKREQGIGVWRGTVWLYLRE
jgi:hypothetical protein